MWSAAPRAPQRGCRAGGPAVAALLGAVYDLQKRRQGAALQRWVDDE